MAYSRQLHARAGTAAGGGLILGIDNGARFWHCIGSEADDLARVKGERKCLRCSLREQLREHWQYW